jgi:hypothetical protein
MYNEETIIYLIGIDKKSLIIYDEDHMVIHSHEKNFKGFKNEFRRKKLQLDSTIFVMKNYFNYKLSSLFLYKFFFWSKACLIFCIKLINNFKRKSGNL